MSIETINSFRQPKIANQSYEFTDNIKPVIIHSTFLPIKKMLTNIFKNVVNIFYTHFFNIFQMLDQLFSNKHFSTFFEKYWFFKEYWPNIFLKKYFLRMLTQHFSQLLSTFFSNIESTFSTKVASTVVVLGTAVGVGGAPRGRRWRLVGLGGSRREMWGNKLGLKILGYRGLVLGFYWVIVSIHTNFWKIYMIWL